MGKFALAEPPGPLPDWYGIVNLVFCALFTLELSTRIVAFRMEFLFGSEVPWNVFDSLLVLSQIVEIFFQGTNISAIRVIRVLRLIRTLRIIRIINFFRQLRMMVCCIGN